MKKFLTLLAILLLVSVTADAEIAPQANIGFNTGTNCPGGSTSGTPCFVSYGNGLPVVGGSAVSSLVLKNVPDSLYSAYAECSSACWLMIFNAVSAPSNGSTTAGVASGNMQDCVPIAAGGVGGVNYAMSPELFTVGITAAISSTTCATLTLSTVGFIHGQVQ